MKHYTKLSLAMVLTLDLMLTGFNAAAASDQKSSLSFTNDGIASFGHIAEINFIDFNNHMTDFTSHDKNSLFTPVRTGTSFRDQLDYYRTHQVLAHEEPNHEFMEFREHNFHERHWEERSVSAVPEPSEYVLLACGLGLLAFVAARRRTDQRFTVA